MLITCSLAGCAGFSVDKVKYYNEVLATVDETKITRYDLLSAYNSYGNSYYVQQMGQSEEEALSSTLNLLIDRELMYQYALDDNAKYKPSAYQVNEVVKEMFDSMDEQMDKYIESAKEALNIKDEEKPEEEKEEDNKVFKLDDYVYSSRATVSSDGKILYIEEKEPENFEALILEGYLTNFTDKNIDKELKNKYFAHLMEDLTVDEGENATAIYNKIRSLFAKDLINYEYYLRDENGKSYSKDNESLFNRYFDRTFKNQIKSQYLENVRVEFLKNEELDITLLVDEFEYLANLNYNTYNNNHSAYQSKMKDIGTSGDTVLYHPETDAQFGYFIHTLISFDSVKENLKLLEGYKGDDKDDLYNQIVSQVTVKPRDAETGTVLEDTTEVKLEDILAEYETIRTGSFANEQERMAEFIKFMFKYTGDTATLSSGMPYVVGTNGYSAMETAFTNEAILLMTGKDADGKLVGTGKVGNMSKSDLSNIKNMCVTSYGIHLLYYVGDVNAFDVNINEASNVYISETDITGKEHLNLYSKIVNPLTKKTYFDLMFDLVYPAGSEEVYTTNNGYSNYEDIITEESRSNHPVTKYTSKIKATKTKI